MTLSLSNQNADVFVPDAAEVGVALARTTHLAVGAHQDDLEFMAAHGVIECFQNSARWFTGVVVTDGAGSARDFEYKAYSNERMMAVRKLEQRKAAFVGEYSAMLQLGHPSQVVKDAAAAAVVADLTVILSETRPEVVYTHNLADKHDTHVAVALRVIAACQKLAPEARPQRIIGCEVWRDLDWLCDADKVVMPVDGHENLHAALMGVFDSQIAGGKRYDLATAGRRRAHATYFEAHGTDQHAALIWGMDLTPLLSGADPAQLVKTYISRFEAEVAARLARFSPQR
ncbi:MAG TPA: PIG-L family deacetylase [Polyangiaceae bacterium]|nr:PIG-L family deacetylase [Polyangiaceae bacterium]